MTKARDIADFKFENIVDTGTEGTKVASGTTAQRGSTAGQIRFNSTTGLAEYYDGSAFKVIDIAPLITASNVSNITETQIDAGFDLVITGTNFSSGSIVKFIGNDGTEYTSPTVTVNSDTQITARVNTNIDITKEPFDVSVTSAGGLSSVKEDVFNINATPTWNTSAGNLGTINDLNDATHFTLSATDPEGGSVSYTESTSNLTGAGLALNSSNGQITGNPNNVTSDTTVSFSVNASDGSNTVNRSFNIIVQQALDGSTQALSAPSAAHIKTLTGTTTNGTYWIKPTGVSTGYQQYCNMNIDGGVILAAKISAGSSSYWHYNSNLWTTNNNYNSSQLNITDDHAKYQSAQDFPANYLYVTNDDMTRWVRFDLASQTTGFHNIWTSGTAFSVTGSTVGTHVSANPPVETDHGTYHDSNGSYTVSGENLADFDTEDWTKEAYVGAYGAGEGRVRLGKIRWNDPGPWEGVHTTARGLGIKAGYHTDSSSNNVSYDQRSASRRQMIFLR